MDHNTLWFIANGMTRPTGPQGPRPYKSGPSPAAPPGPCYNCGENHWIRDCPYPRKDRPQPTTAVQPLARFCIDCGVKHFVQDCPLHPDKKGKTSLNFIEPLPSTDTPGSSESDKVVPLKAITRAQAQANAEKRKEKEETEPEATPSESTEKSRGTWKQRRARRVASKKKRAEMEQAAIQETKQQTQEGEPKISQKDTSNETKQNKEQSAGSVLVDKVHEPLDALLKAYEARLKPLETMERIDGETILTQP